ncbi:MAG TPA: hypothetical protein DIT48_12635 [Actinobacteria bacterium]|jgi:anti-sigma-K factor RskA|nr:hypothetical protein [Actinomycetota bacterium]
MWPDPLAGSEVPDRIPDELLQQYSAEARKAVQRRYRVPRRSPARMLHRLIASARDGNFWPASIALSLAAAASLVMFGAIGYAVYLWPEPAVYVAIALSASGAGVAAVSLVRRLRGRLRT